MNIKAVIVDELPKSAIYCPMFGDVRAECSTGVKIIHISCRILGNDRVTSLFDYQTGRCPGCPLVTDYCEVIK